jgi:hypothetical protein
MNFASLISKRYRYNEEKSRKKRKDSFLKNTIE